MQAVDDRHTQLEQAAAQALLGYLNFSDGRPDPRWQRQLDDAYDRFVKVGASRPWETLLAALRSHLHQLHASGSAAFRDQTQADAVLTLASEVLPAYRRHHADLLAHLDDADIFGSFFLARVFEAVLALRQAPEPVAAVLNRLNDFVGHRPIAILETRQQGEPYEHERHRPLPLYLRGAGVAFGRYHDVIERAVQILRDTDPGLLSEACFQIERLEEMAVDLRAYDHGHPANRRPNYVFGEWDPHQIDNSGRYRRYVIRNITLDALMDRVENAPDLDPEHRLFEGAAVLAGTILMAAGVSGWGPSAHDSSTSLATLLPRIARYRDAFYQQLLARVSGTLADRLRQELQTTRQPFGAARQHLNAYLARHRATQMQQRYLALLFAEMGYPHASQIEARRIMAVSVRLLSDILGRLTTGQVECEQGRLHQAAGRLAEVEDLLRRGIACGAFADPWNILGFQGLFPLSPTREDAIRDPRLDELVQVVEQTFTLYARLMAEGSAAGESELTAQLDSGMERLARWWDPFATYEVSDLRRVHGGEAAASARNVAAALAAWRQRGEATSDLAFWRDRLDEFRSPKAFALVVEALLLKNDHRAALGLLASWLSQAEQVPMEDGNHSFHNLALRWMLTLQEAHRTASSPLSPSRSTGVSPVVADADTGETPVLRGPTDGGEPTTAPHIALVCKFLDYLEANAEEYWEVPSLQGIAHTDDDEEEEEEDDPFEAAYEGVTYRDSTAGDEGAVSDGAPTEVFDLEEEGDRLEKRLRFLSTLARLWQIGARLLAEPGRPTGNRATVLESWLSTARRNRQQLLELLDDIHAHDLPDPTGDYDSIVEYDRRRVLKEQLIYTTIATCLDTSMAVGALRGALRRDGRSESDAPAWESESLRLERALFAGDSNAARASLVRFTERFRSEPLLFTPLSENFGGGDPRAILRVRIAQAVLRALVSNLPRLGLLRETYELLRTARAMEQAQPTEGRGVTEFNHYFQSAYQAVIENVVRSSIHWSGAAAEDGHIVDVLERLTMPFLALWGEHSRTLQLSVLEGITTDSEWQALVDFVKRYGSDLFHARFLTLGNLRGILHRGAGAYLDYLCDNPDPLRPVRLIDELDRDISRQDAIRRLELVLHAVIENYEEYKDYNTTTTQSDYGENLHVFLDFLRLKVAYERYAWQFRPLVLAHEVLARHGRSSTALRWEESLTHFTRELARKQLEELARLEQQHGVRLGTIRDRLNERFVKPLALDRLCALIDPCLREARQDGPEEDRPAFRHLQAELRTYTTSPTGVGLDVPSWLRRLEAEVHRVQANRTTVAVLAENFFRIPRRPVSHEEVQRQLREWERPALPS
jgi:hypothetical protein